MSQNLRFSPLLNYICAFWNMSQIAQLSSQKHRIGMPGFRGRLNLIKDRPTREQLIEVLATNDPNGIYTDEDSLSEYDTVLSYEEAVFWFATKAFEDYNSDSQMIYDYISTQLEL